MGNSITVTKPIYKTDTKLQVSFLTGSVKTVCEISKRGKEGVFQIKIAKRLYPKEELEKMLDGKPGGCQVVMKVMHPETGVVLVTLGYKYNTKTTLCFVTTKNAGSTTEGKPYKMKYLDGSGNLCIREVEQPEVVSDFFSHVNIIVSLNHLHQFCLHLEKKWVTHSFFFHINTTLMGINVVDTSMLCYHCNLLQHHDHGIHLNMLMKKCASDQKEDIDDIHGYSMTQFGGILGCQLLNLADIYDDKLRMKIPGSIKRTGVQRSNSFSSVSMASSFSSTNILHSTGRNDSMTDVGAGMKRNAAFHDIVAEGKKDDDDVEIVENRNTSVAMSSSQLDGRVCSSDVLVTYCDTLGVYHHGMKLQKKRTEHRWSEIYTIEKMLLSRL
jgi:hypothetical protein